MSKVSLGRAALLMVSVLSALALYSSAAYASGPPIVTVGAASNLTLNTATLNGTVDSNGASTTYKFEYGKSKLYGNSTTVKTIKSGSAAISELLVGLENLATYHFRVSATNSFGTTVSEDMTLEMLLSWKSEGKSLSGAEFVSEPYLGNDAFKIAGKVGLSSVEITCSIEGETGELHRTRGVLGDHYTVPLFACVTKLNGAVSKKCSPPNIEVKFNAVFVVSAGQALTLGSECAIGNKIELSGAGFGAGPMAEQQELPVSFSAILPAVPGLTMTYSSHWILTAPNVSKPFGIS